MISRTERDTIDFQNFDFFPQPQSWPQPDFFFGFARRTRKMASVRITIPTAVQVCQFMMLESKEPAGLEDDERKGICETAHENKLPGSPFPRTRLAGDHRCGG